MASLLRQHPAMRRWLKRLRAMAVPTDVPFVPPGHFYSPIVDVRAVAAEKERLWPAQPVVAGVDWNDAGHRQLLTESFPRCLPLYDYPESLPDGPLKTAVLRLARRI